MMRRSILLFLLIFCCYTFAQQHWYVGLSSGIGIADNHVALTYPIPPTQDDPSTVHQTHVAMFGVLSGLHAGYGIVSRSSGWGLQAQVNTYFSSLNEQETVKHFFKENNAGVDRHLNTLWQLDLGVTKSISKSTQFVFGGIVAQSRYQSDITDSGGRQAASVDYTKQLLGVGGMAGLAVQLGQHWRVQFTQQYLTYPALSVQALEPNSGSQSLREQTQLASFKTQIDLSWVF